MQGLAGLHFLRNAAMLSFADDVASRRPRRSTSAVFARDAESRAARPASDISRRRIVVVLRDRSRCRSTVCASHPRPGSDGAAAAHVARVRCRSTTRPRRSPRSTAPFAAASRIAISARRLAQRREQVVRHAAAEVDHAGGEDRVEVLLAAAVAAAIDRHVDRLDRRIDAA